MKTIICTFILLFAAFNCHAQAVEVKPVFSFTLDGLYDLESKDDEGYWLTLALEYDLDAERELGDGAEFIVVPTLSKPRFTAEGTVERETDPYVIRTLRTIARRLEEGTLSERYARSWISGILDGRLTRQVIETKPSPIDDQEVLWNIYDVIYENVRRHHVETRKLNNTVEGDWVEWHSGQAGDVRWGLWADIFRNEERRDLGHNRYTRYSYKIVFNDLYEYEYSGAVYQVLLDNIAGRDVILVSRRMNAGNSITNRYTITTAFDYAELTAQETTP